MCEETPADPARALAETIVDKLIAEGLVAGQKRTEITAKVASGTAKAEDWGLWSELAAADVNREQGGPNGNDPAEGEA
ncbi:MAG: hypothetical protein N838_30890 [Thiohalocapsa sp. PB-PSB1]|jgi:hypothetical protein|nr:MAG: hypothetical protein N838_23250 [Thiohalocapsa sp. PB-PSB1]QQO57108.1 MAG: hypothetical protein N838_30890 [Thiohalocapsa sp. PB-PSB1]